MRHADPGLAGPEIAAIVFTDMVGSTEIRARIGEQRANLLRRAHDRLLLASIDANRGTLVRNRGDGVVAAFRSASDAVAAAVGMQQAVRAYSRRRDALADVRIRVGIAVGEITWTDGDCAGLVMAEAARLEALAGGGRIVCTDHVRIFAGTRPGHDFRPLGFYDLKGLPEPVPVCEVAWEREPDPTSLPLPAEFERGGLPFVARDADLTAAEAVIHDAGRDRLAVVWVLGEPGIGKTRLAAEIARRAHAAGATALLGRCSPDVMIPYQPFVEALQTYVGALPDAALDEELGDGTASLQRLVPSLAARMGKRHEPGAAPSRLEQHRLFDAVAGWLAAASAGRDVVLIVDDVHWASRETLAMLRHVARSAQPSRAALVCTARNTAPDRSGAVAALAADVAASGIPGVTIELSGLGAEAVGDLLTRVTGRVLDRSGQALVRRIHDDTAGNPLFVDAVLSDLAAEPSGGAPAASRPLRTLASTIEARVARLPGAAGSLLRTAAVAGVTFDLRVAARAERCDGDAALVMVEAGMAAGIVDEDAVGQYRFRHALVRDALRSGLTRTRRARIHALVAEAAEAVHGNAAGEHAPFLAYHYSEAIPLGTGPQAFHWTVVAAERATSLLSHEEAAAAYARALDLARHAQSRRARFDVLMALGGAQRRTGDVLSALATARAAIDEAAAVGDPPALAQAAVAFEETSFWLGHAGDDAVDPLRRAVAALAPGEDGLRALTLAALARALDTSGRPDGDGPAREALATAARLTDTAARFAVLVRTTRSTLTIAEADAAAARWEEVARQAQEVGDDDERMLAHGQLMWSRLMLGRVAGADDEFARFRAAAELLREPRWSCMGETFAAARASLAGDLDAAECSLSRAERLGSGFGWLREGLHGLAMFALRREQGRLGEIAPLLGALSRAGRRPGVWRPGVAALWTALGRLEDARAEVEALVPGVLESLGPADRELTAAVLAEPCAAAGDPTRASALLDVLEPCRGRLVAFLLCGTTLGPVDRLLGMLCAAAGRMDEAERLHNTALSLARRTNSPLWTARCLLDAAMLPGPRRTGRWRTMLDEARQLCSVHKLPAMGRSVAEVLADG